MDNKNSYNIISHVQKYRTKTENNKESEGRYIKVQDWISSDENYNVWDENYTSTLDSWNSRLDTAEERLLTWWSRNTDDQNETQRKRII